MIYRRRIVSPAGAKELANSRRRLERPSSRSSRIELLFFALAFLSIPLIGQAQQQSESKQIDTDQTKNLAAQAKLAPKEDQALSTNTGSGRPSASIEDLVQNLRGTPDTLVTPPPRPTIPTAPVLDLSDAQRANLESQFQALQDLRDTEDAFSEKLGETYFSYGAALLESGQVDEARKMYAQALHVTKINNGVNSIEQRPILRSLFHIELAKGDLEKAEEYVKRMVWVEKQHPKQRDTYSFDAIVDLGNEFVDRYLHRPAAGEASLMLLNSATRYFRYAISRYGDQPINRLTMPYGEMAYAQYLKSTITAQIEPRPRFQDLNRNQARFRQLERDRPQQIVFPRNPLGGSERYMRQYLAKAQQGNDLEHAIKALLNLGDVNLLFGRRGFAEQFYGEAWRLAQSLEPDHELVVLMQEPVMLPAFFYSRERAEVEKFSPEVLYPLDLSIDENGKVAKVLTDIDASETPKIAKRAKRLTRRLTFRPAIDGGRLVGTDTFTHSVSVKVRRSEEDQTSVAGN